MSGVDMRVMRLLLMAVGLLAGVVQADITVSDVEVFSGCPWKEVVVGYTITGFDNNEAEIQLTATDKMANKIYTAISLKDAMLTEGRHVMRWDVASEGVRFSSTNVVFTVSVIVADCVQLWMNGPYWAKCNLGATKPEDYGCYFWWGDTCGATWDGVSWSVLPDYHLSFDSQYCKTSGKSESSLVSKGYIYSRNLVAQYDAGTKLLGAPWRMPTATEWSELISNCDMKETSRNGVHGILVTGKGIYASKSIFLPSAGYGSGQNFCRGDGYYWSSTWYDSLDFNVARSVEFINGSIRLSQNARHKGLTIRPLRGSAL